MVPVGASLARVRQECVLLGSPINIVEAGSLLVVSGNHGAHAEAHPLVVVGHVGQQLASSRHADPLAIPAVERQNDFQIRPGTVMAKQKFCVILNWIVMKMQRIIGGAYAQFYH